MAFRSSALLLCACACGRIGFDGALGSDDATSIDPTLIAWYLLDDQPSALAYADATGRGPTLLCGSVTVCPTTTAGPHGGVAAHFDGNDQCLRAMPAIDLVAPYTITLWARPERVPGFFDNFIGRPFGTVHEDTYALDIISDGTAEFFTPIQGHLSGMTPLTIDTWAHLAATYDGSIKKLYVNGVVDGVDLFSGPMQSDNHPMYVGCDEDDGAVTGFLQGAMSDVRFYTRVLSDAELMALARP